MANKIIPQSTDERIAKRDELFEALTRESDRGLILVSASYLDIALEDLLRSKFTSLNKASSVIINSLFDNFGPLSSFSAKIKIVYAMGLVEEWVYHDLEVIRKLRNEFAHGMGLAAFSSKEVVRLTELLKGADHAVTQLSKQKVKTLKPNTRKRATKSIELEKGKMERMRVTMTVSYIGGLLYVQTEHLIIDLKTS
jgi:DNA-binding MltR family transcriptional regulator